MGHHVTLLAVLAVLVVGAAAGFAADAKPDTGQDTTSRPSPEEFYNSVRRNAENKRAQLGAGEGFCWHANTGMSQWVAAYQAWHDTAWLDWGVKYFDYVVAQMSTGPDGYKGWIGPYGYDGKVWCDVHVGDAILIEKMLDFSELVLKDKDLTTRYGEAAKRYVELARRDLIEKWDSRGTWREDGPFGAYVSWDTYCPPEDLKTWKKMPEVNGSNLTLPFNKQNDMALALMKLYRITGQAKYRDKAVRIYSFMKSRFQLVDDHGGYYVWNYWEPFGPWDVEPDLKDTRHWMNVHGYRNYQAGEIHQIVEAYHSGIVFSELDLRRIITTNLKVMWNGDTASPKYVNSNAALPEPPLTEDQRKAQEEAVKSNPLSKEGRAGTLWTALVDFDPTIRALYAAQTGDPKSAGGRIALAHYRNVTAKSPPGFKRHHVAENQATVVDFPFHPCKSLTALAVMPSVVAGGAKSVVMCKARIPVELKVALYSADGKEKLLVLHSGPVPGGTDGHAGIFILEFDGKDPAGKVDLKSGAYRMRWTVPDGYREYPVTVGK